MTKPHASSNSLLCTCPLHPSTAPTLAVHETTHGVYFKCSEPTCSFDGDALQLCARWMRCKTPEEAVKYFEPGGQWHHLAIPDHQPIEYPNKAANQAAIDAYMVACHEFIRNSRTPQAARVYTCLGRNNLIHLSRGDVPKDVGALTPINIPGELARLQHASIVDRPHIVYAYRNEGRIVDLDIQNIETGLTERVPVSKAIGAFTPGNSPLSPMAAITPYNQLALMLYSAAKVAVAPPADVAAVAPGRLPSNLRHATDVIVLSPQQFPVSLHQLLEWFLAPNPIVDKTGAPTFHICRASTIELNKMDTDAMLRHSTPLITHLSWFMRALYADNNTNELRSAFTGLKPHEDRMRLLTARLLADNAPAAMLTTMSDIAQASQGYHTLPNGNAILTDEAGILGLRVNGGRVRLSNVSFVVHRQVLSSTGELLCGCTIKAGAHTIAADIPHAAFASTRQLHTAIGAACTPLGVMPALSIYAVAGFQWTDIRDAYTESAVIARELQRTGIDESGCIHFPNFIIRSDYALSAQPASSRGTQLFDLWRGFELSNAETTNSYHELWSSKDPGAVIMAIAISQLIFYIFDGTRFAKNKAADVRHLLFTYTLLNTIDISFRYLSYLCAGTGAEFRIPNARSDRYDDSMRALGTFPLIGNLPATTAKRQAKLVGDSRHSIITLIADDDVPEFSKMRNVCYVVCPTYYPPLSGGFIARLRAEFPCFLRDVYAHFRTAAPVIPELSNLPATIIHGAIARMLKTQTVDTTKYIRAHFAPPDSAADIEFIRGVRQALTDKELKILDKGMLKTALQFAPYQNLYLQGEEIFVNKKVVRLVNNHRPSNRRLSIGSIEDSLRDNERLIQTVGAWWSIPWELVQRVISRAPLQLNGGFAGGGRFSTAERVTRDSAG